MTSAITAEDEMPKGFFHVAKGTDAPGWAVYLYHQCDEWDIAGETAMGGSWGITREEAVRRLEVFLADGRLALEHLKAGQEYEA